MPSRKLKQYVPDGDPIQVAGNEAKALEDDAAMALDILSELIDQLERKMMVVVKNRDFERR